MEIRKDLLYKPNQTVMITNNNITSTQRKAFNVILFKAWNDLKKNPNLIEFNFVISELKDKAGLTATDNVKLKKSLHELTTIGVEIVKDNGDWEVFSLLSYAKKEIDFLVIELPKPIRQALIDNTYYTTFDLLTLKSLQGKYAIILYEMAIRYQKRQIPEMDIEELKLLTGTEKIKGYNNFKNFNDRVLTSAINEINEKTDIILNFEKIKRGRKIIAIKFTVKTKDSISKLEPAVDNLKQIKTDINIDLSNLIAQFKIKYNADLDKHITEKLVKKMGLAHIMACFDTYIEFYKNRNIVNIAGDFYTYCTKGYTKSIGHKSYCDVIHNFEERDYSDEDFNQYMSNLKN